MAPQDNSVKEQKDFLNITRYFSKETVSPYDEFNWKTLDISINDDLGKPLFVQKGVDFPEHYSDLARKIVTSRYAYGKNGTSERENSLKTIIGRVSETYGKQALQKGYLNEEESKIFTDEIAKLTLEQRASFNSPVWFNVGTDIYESRINHEKSDGYHIEKGKAVKTNVGENHLYPQTSACFIQGVEDNMESIMNLSVNEAMLFKHGSGTGTDLSSLRSGKEELSGGGKPSGPLAYLEFYDKVAGIVKSGGKTRRAAKMNSLRISHPDIKEFILAKTVEEKKARALIEAGYSFKEAYETVAYQNVNLSVRLSDKFMRAFEKDSDWQTISVHSKNLAREMPKYKAKDLMDLISKSAWDCGDPGVQFEDTINKWNTCKNSGEINASNPCSEYMFLDNSSCNLASFNLRRFQKEDGSFDIRSFEKGIETFSIAMDLNYEFSSFPTEEITQNSYDYRPLGLGYANLGALLMSEGLAYDSDEARVLAASITSLMTANVYHTSTVMAEKLGPFKEFERNKEPMMEVMKMHRDALNKIDTNKLPQKFLPIFERSSQLWDKVIERGEKHGFRNAQATVLAPTGTIGFMMGCDTTGIEPELAQIKYKNLSEGGSLKIVNKTIPTALRKLGYDERQIKSIEDYLLEEENIEGAPFLKEEHLSVFDCSFKPSNGKRFIPWEGHVKMMAAVQPYLSGAISKTVNMHKDSTTKDVQDAYKMAWKEGLKSIAIYRDDCKKGQPLQTGKGKLEKKLSPEPAKRVKLPVERVALNHKFTIGGQDVYVNVGHYDDGIPGEIFLVAQNQGSFVRGLMDILGISMSLGLQHGVPLGAYVKKLIGSNFPPNGIVEEGIEDTRFRFVKSILDYLGKYLSFKYNCENVGFSNNRENKTDLNPVPDSSSNRTLEETEMENFERQKSDNLCIGCGNNTHTYQIGNCAILCDPREGGCGTFNQQGCSG